jgi:predicted DNA-binding WGR domain protein
MIRLETENRYYAIQLQVHLLGDLVVTCSYGLLNSKLNHTHTYFKPNRKAAIEKIRNIVSTRYKHGYDLIENTENIEL